MPGTLAKRRVDPTWTSGPEWVETFGPEVADVCALAGFPPDPEQQMILDGIFAIGSDGKSAAFEVDVIGPRQNLKTGLIKQAELGWLFVTDERLVVHSAHELSTTEEAFKETSALILDTPALARRLAPGPAGGIYEGNGRWSIELATGQRLKYKARTKGGGRGLTGNKVVLDEGFALLATHLGALLPTLAAVPDPQVLTASSAGKLESAVLRDKRDRGRKGLSPRQLYYEWGDPDQPEHGKIFRGCLRVDCDHAKTTRGCALDDEKRWARTNPALGRRITLETLRAMRQAMPPAEFAREFLVWWEDPDPAAETPHAIDQAAWADRMNLKARKPKGPVVLAIDVNPDRSRAAIGMAGRGRGGRVLVMTKSGAGIGWVVPTLKRLRSKHEVLEVVLNPSGQAGALLTELVDAEIPYVPLKQTEAGQATAGFIEGVLRDRIEHVGQPRLDAAVAGARTRFYGEAELFDRREPGAEISEVVAVSLAAHRFGLTKSTQPAIPSASYI